MTYDDLDSLREACEAAPVELDRWALLDLIFEEITDGLGPDWAVPLAKLAKLALAGRREDVDPHGVYTPGAKRIEDQAVEDALQALADSVLDEYDLVADVKGKIMVQVRSSSVDVHPTTAVK